MKVILIAVSDPAIAVRVARVVEDLDHHPVSVDGINDAFAYLDAGGVADLVIADLGASGVVLESASADMRRRHHHPPFVILTDDPRPRTDGEVAGQLATAFTLADLARAIRSAL